MAAERNPTGRVIEALWKRWSARYRHENGHVISKSGVSTNYFEGDRNLLARWTGAASRPRWRFPLARLDELAATFEMDQADVDDLMTARVEELQDDEEVARLLTWLAGFLDRTALDDEERQVLQAWREVRAARLLGFYNDGRQAFELRQLLDGLLALHQARHEEEQAEAQAQEEALTPEQAAALRERVRGVSQKLASQVLTHKQRLVRAKAETQALLKRLRGVKSRRKPGASRPVP